MQIVSPFSDYYDLVEQHRTNTVYFREPYSQNLSSWPFMYGITRNGTMPVAARPIVIGFCGQLYPVIKIGKVYCYSLAAIDKFSRSLSGAIRTKFDPDHGWSQCKNFRYYLGGFSGKFSDLAKPNAPIYVVRQMSNNTAMVQYNPSLNALGFSEHYGSNYTHFTIEDYLAAQK